MGCARSRVSNPRWPRRSMTSIVAEQTFLRLQRHVLFIAQTQAYLDGNKRTGVAAALAFLQINEVSTDRDAFPLCAALVNVAEGRMTKAELAVCFRQLFGA